MVANISTPGGTPPQGVCLLRTSDLSDASSWRAWDGSGFSVDPESSETAGAAPDSHLCQPVSTTSLIPYSLTYNAYLGNT